MFIASIGGDTAHTVFEFWNWFNIKLTIDIIREAWNVTKACWHRVWHKILPDLIYDSKGFEPSEEVPQIKAGCVALAKEIGFEEVESEDFEELLQCHAEALSTQEPSLYFLHYHCISWKVWKCLSTWTSDDDIPLSLPYCFHTPLSNKIPSPC